MKIISTSSRGEHIFEEAMTSSVCLIGCYYMKLKDPVMIAGRTSYLTKFPEVQRPFDGILVTPSGNLMLELKYNRNKPSPHQVNEAYKINKINTSHYFVRKSDYYIEDKGKIVSVYTVECLNNKSVIWEMKKNKMLPKKWKLDIVYTASELMELLRYLLNMKKCI